MNEKEAIEVASHEEALALNDQDMAFAEVNALIKDLSK